MKKQLLFIMAVTMTSSIAFAASDVIATARNEGCIDFCKTVDSSPRLSENAKKNEGEAGSLAPFTVFVPNDAAFAGLDDVKKKKCIPFHVVPGKKLDTIEKVKTEMKTGVSTVGEKLLFCADDKIFLDESSIKASIVKGPIVASNGIVFIIDKVLLAGQQDTTPATGQVPAAQSPSNAQSPPVTPPAPAAS